MQKELRIMPTEGEPNVYFGFMTTTVAGFICLPTTCVVERGTEAGTSCLLLLNPANMVIVQLIHVIQGLEKKELSVGYLIRTKER